MKDASHPAHHWSLGDGRVRSAVVAALALATLGVDYVTGPTFLMPVWYALPVVLAAWYDGFAAGAAFAVALPLSRLLMKYIWPDVPWPLSLSYMNMLSRITALLIIAYLTALNGALTRRVRVLRGLLPMCMHCQKIRNESGEWEKVADYVAERSEAEFSHGICRECLKRPEYKDLID